MNYLLKDFQFNSNKSRESQYKISVDFKSATITHMAFKIVLFIALTFAINGKIVFLKF